MVNINRKLIRNIRQIRFSGCRDGVLHVTSRQGNKGHFDLNNDCYIHERSNDIKRLLSLVYFVGGALLNSFVFSKTKLYTCHTHTEREKRERKLCGCSWYCVLFASQSQFPIGTWHMDILAKLLGENNNAQQQTPATTYEWWLLIFFSIFFVVKS